MQHYFCTAMQSYKYISRISSQNGKISKEPSRGNR